MGGRCLMAKTILNFHFDYLTTPLSIMSGSQIIRYPLSVIKITIIINITINIMCSSQIILLLALVGYRSPPGWPGPSMTTEMINNYVIGRKHMMVENNGYQQLCNLSQK